LAATEDPLGPAMMVASATEDPLRPAMMAGTEDPLPVVAAGTTGGGGGNGRPVTGGGVSNGRHVTTGGRKSYTTDLHCTKRVKGKKIMEPIDS